MKRKLNCTNYFIILGKKRFPREHTKNPNAYVRARPDVTFWSMGYHSPESHIAFYIYYVKYENTLTCKRISWNSGGGGGWMMFKNIFLFPICIVQKVTTFAPQKSRTFIEIENQMQNHKIETNSKLISVDGSI